MALPADDDERRAAAEPRRRHARRCAFALCVLPLSTAHVSAGCLRSVPEVDPRIVEDKEINTFMPASQVSTLLWPSAPLQALACLRVWSCHGVSVRFPFPNALMFHLVSSRVCVRMSARSFVCCPCRTTPHLCGERSSLPGQWMQRLTLWLSRWVRGECRSVVLSLGFESRLASL